MEADLKCPKCGSSQTRCRIKTNERVCYSCGNIWEIKEQEDKR
jgi:transcription initiation factor TFIIIB Brf1 subunit/transcription initiation factor TFIIB